MVAFTVSVESAAFPTSYPKIIREAGKTLVLYVINYRLAHFGFVPTYRAFMGVFCQYRGVGDTSFLNWVITVRVQCH